MTTQPTPVPPPRQLADWENLIAGRWLFGAGLALVLLGTGFFLNLAFNNGWIDPTGRVALGLSGGTLLVGLGEFFWRRDRAVYANGLAALGSAILFLSLYAGYAVFKLAVMPAEVAFGAMVVVTAGVCAMAYQRSSLLLGILGLAGAMLAPMLAGQTVIRYSGIACYLALIASGMLVLATAKRWRVLEGTTFVAVAAYSPFIIDWTLEPAHGTAHFEALASAAMMFAPFACVWFIRALRTGFDRSLTAAVLFSSAWFVTMVEYTFYGEQTDLAIALLSFAALAVAAEYATRRKTYAWVAIGAVTAAVPAIFHHGGITAAWAIEAAILVALGARGSDPVLRALGYSALLIAVASTIAPGSALPSAVTKPFLNDRFIPLIAIAAALGFISAQLRIYGALVYREEGSLVIPAHVAAAALAVIASTLDIHDFYVNEAAITLTWTVAAAIMIALGARSQSWLLRWEGLALFAIAIAKVGIVDLGSLELTYRVLSTIGLGTVLVAVAAWYQHRPAHAREEQ